MDQQSEYRRRRSHNLAYKEYQREYQKNYYLIHKNAILQRQREYDSAHKEQRRENIRKYRERRSFGTKE
jgi:hypothetical protein